MQKCVLLYCVSRYCCFYFLCFLIILHSWHILQLCMFYAAEDMALNRWMFSNQLINLGYELERRRMYMDGYTCIM